MGGINDFPVLRRLRFPGTPKCTSTIPFSNEVKIKTQTGGHADVSCQNGMETLENRGHRRSRNETGAETTAG